MGKTNQLSSLFLLVIYLFPLTMFGKIGSHILGNESTYGYDWMATLGAGIFGIIGGLLGHGLKLIATKNNLVIKIACIVFAILIPSATYLYLVRYSPYKLDKFKTKDETNAKTQTTTDDEYTTCPACGYVAFIKGEEYCENCEATYTEEEMKIWGFSNMKSYLKYLQADWFLTYTDTFSTDLTYYISEEIEFKKDSSWLPTITYNELLLLKPLIESLNEDDYSKAAIDILSIK